jgi:hypothetical protein
MSDITQTSNLEGPPPLQIAPAPQKPSGMAKASFVIGLVSAGIFLVVIAFSVIAVSMGVANPHAGQGPNAGMNSKIALFAVVGLLAIINVVLNVVGFILGIVAVQKSIPNKWMAITGAIMNGAAAAVMILLFVIGIANRHHAT